MMTSDQLASMYAEVVRGTPKAESRFTRESGFSDTWDEVAAQVEQIRADDPNAVFDIPYEVAG